MKETQKIKEKLNAIKEKESFDILNSELKSELKESINTILKDIDDIERLDSVKNEISTKVIKPVAKLIQQKNRLQLFASISSIASLLLALFTLWNTHFNQSRIIKEASREAFEHISPRVKPASLNIFQDKTKKYGLMDNSNTVVLQPEYENINQLTNTGYGTLYKAFKNNRCYLINILGEMVETQEFTNIEFFNQNQLKATNKYGFKSIINFKGEILVPFRFKELIGIEKDYIFYLDKNKSKWGVYNSQSNEIISPPIFKKVILTSGGLKTFLAIKESLIEVYEYPCRYIGTTIYTRRHKDNGFYIIPDSKGNQVKIIALENDEISGLIDQFGSDLIEPKFKIIEWAGENKFRIGNKTSDLKEIILVAKNAYR
jgi:hypothetical protein